jgi:malate/lactate dehydrogenase
MAVMVGIHGAAGAVGAATAFTLAQGGDVRLVLADAAAGRLACLVADLEMLRAARPRLAVTAGGLGALAACDVVVACASVPHRDGAPRADFFADNTAVLAPLAEALAEPDAACRTLVLVSNPVDALATRLAQRLGTRTRVVGHTLNDTLRLRVAIARVRGCEPGAVEAWSAGEHGPHAVPLLSRVSVRGVPVVLSSAERTRVRDEVSGWYARWQAHRTGTTSAWASGWGAAALVRALLEGDSRPWPVSIPLRGHHGVDGVCLTVPARLEAGVPPRPLAWVLDDEERAGIAAAAAAVEEVACASC